MRDGREVFDLVVEQFMNLRDPISENSDGRDILLDGFGTNVMPRISCTCLVSCDPDRACGKRVESLETSSNKRKFDFDVACGTTAVVHEDHNHE